MLSKEHLDEWIDSLLVKVPSFMQEHKNLIKMLTVTQLKTENENGILAHDLNLLLEWLQERKKEGEI